MWAFVTPSARQCGPPELLATLPPIEHVCWLLGSGAKCSPCSATARREVEVEHAGLDPRPARRRRRRRGCGSSSSSRSRRRRPAARRRRRARCPSRGRRTARRGGRRWPRTPAPRRSSAGSRRRRRRPPCPDASWRYSDSSVAPSRTRSGDERPAQLVDERRVAVGRRGAAAVTPAGGLGPAHQDDAAGLDRLAVDEHLVAGVQVVAEAHEPPVALGAQLALADLGRRPTLAHGVGDAPRRALAPSRRRHGRRSPAPACAPWR